MLWSYVYQYNKMVKFSDVLWNELIKNGHKKNSDIFLEKYIAKVSQTYYVSSESSDGNEENSKDEFLIHNMDIQSLFEFDKNKKIFNIKSNSSSTLDNKCILIQKENQYEEISKKCTILSWMKYICMINMFLYISLID